jgi:hypothetical protein
MEGRTSGKAESRMSMTRPTMLEGFGPLSTEPNPCVRVWGPGPEDAKCKTCSHLHVRRYANTYYKCDLRKMSPSTATDHRVSWRACGKYEVAS